MSRGNIKRNNKRIFLNKVFMNRALIRKILSTEDSIYITIRNKCGELESYAIQESKNKDLKNTILASEVDIDDLTYNNYTTLHNMYISHDDVSKIVKEIIRIYKEEL